MKLVRALAIAALLIAVATPVTAQEDPPNPVDVFVDALNTAKGKEFASQFLKEPARGSAQVDDPMGDFFHSTGQAPGFTPPHIDILSTWVLDLDDPGGEIFTPTDQNAMWAPTGSFEAPTAEHGTMPTIVGEVPHDGSQYDGGAVLFGFTVLETPPLEVPGRCEYVVWVNDTSRPEAFTNNPSFPQDPAGGTNRAFGLGLNPEGQGMTSTFSLELTPDGFFQSVPEDDIRSFITPGYVGVTVPRDLLGDMAEVNFFTFCVESGFSFEPEETGADQTGLVAISPDDFGVVSIAEFVPTTTTSSSTTSTTSAPTTTSSVPASTTTTAGDTPADEGMFPWWVLIVGGLGLGGYGLFLLLTGGKDPCRELYEAWLAAQTACDDAQAAADEAADACEEAEADLTDLEDERKELCEAWPPACWTTDDGGWIEDDQGNRITSRDLHMRRMALGDVWSDYQAGKLTAQEVEAKWQQMDTPGFREELRETDQEYKEELAEIDADLSKAREKLEETCAAATKAQAKADEACAEADAARKRYEECITAAAEESAAAAATGSGPSGGTSVGPSGPAAAPTPAEPGKDPCEGVEPKRRYEPAGTPDKIDVNVDFAVITGVEGGSERNIAAGQQLTFDLNDLARDLDFIGDMISARSAGLHIGGSANGFASGKYVAASAGVIRGGIDAAMATDLAPEVPTGVVEAGVEMLEGVSRLGSTVARKVTEWMEGQQIMLLWVTMFYQEITATPYRILECRQGVGWVCVEKVWEIEVSKLKKRPRNPNIKRYIVESNLNKARFQAEIRRQSQRAANRVRNDARTLMQWRARHEPGPCS